MNTVQINTLQETIDASNDALDAIWRLTDDLPSIKTRGVTDRLSKAIDAQQAMIDLEKHVASFGPDTVV